MLLCVILCFSTIDFSLFTLHSSYILAQTQHGIASFYAKRATGSRTANGERLHHDSMTCAHRDHPFGTYLRVTHMNNQRSVIVRVNDRGPYVRGRIIDLSWGAARELGMLGQGIAKVEVVVADGIIIPLKAPDEHLTFPKLSIDPIELADTLKPIWQEDLLIDHKKVERHMRRTTQKIIKHQFDQITSRKK